MDYGSLYGFVSNRDAMNKKFWISGYSNPKLRESPTTNVKPTEVTMINNDTNYNVGIYAHDKKKINLVAVDKNNKIISAVQTVMIFDSKDEAESWYEKEVNYVISAYKKRIDRVLKNIKDM